MLGDDAEDDTQFTVEKSENLFPRVLERCLHRSQDSLQSQHQSIQHKCY